MLLASFMAMMIGIILNRMKPTNIDLAVYNFLDSKGRTDEIKNKAVKSIVLLFKLNVLRKKLGKKWRENT